MFLRLILLGFPRRTRLLFLRLRRFVSGQYAVCRGIQRARQIHQLSDVQHGCAPFPTADRLITDSQLFGQLGLGQPGFTPQRADGRARLSHIKHVVLLNHSLVVFHWIVLLTL